MRLLWQSNAPWAGTGYGVQTRLMLGALRDLGHEPVCFAFYGLQGGEIEYEGYPVLPASGFDAWGNDVIRPHVFRSETEAVVTLMDVFVLDGDTYGELAVPWIPWTPIDSLTMGDYTVNPLKKAQYPVAMSLHGAKEMSEAGIEPTAVIYHAVDTDLFKPLDKAECRDSLNLDQDAYIIGMVMANKGDRKQYPLQLMAVKKWIDEKHPDEKVRVFLHTEPTGGMGGWDMKALVAKLGLKGKVWSTNQYDTSVVPAKNDYMPTLYNCFDVLMNVSAGEGFGVPIIEAQACGVPVLTQNVTAMPEITHNGYCVEPAAMGLSSHYGWMFTPDLDDMVYRLECVYRMTDASRRAQGRAWVQANCSVPVIAGIWNDLLQGVAEENAKRVATNRTVIP